LKTKGYPTYKATAAVLVNGIIYFLGQTLLSIPCFIYVCTAPNIASY